ncbi:unnamed protein product [Owenia fusiformis]|uniref:G-protein coupled receptors family 1 profile domain-containing protein n=1 Tax=Owenia fusiformis TaxID=6347 RepID=A0A8S4P463_OWEFU|nr:unnamed protein product [Owenia fusiformis]
MANPSLFNYSLETLGVNMSTNTAVFYINDTFNSTASIFDTDAADNKEVAIRWICVATPLGIIGIVINTLAICAINLSPNSHLTTFYLLMTSLALTDVLGCSIQIMQAVLWYSKFVNRAMYSICFHNTFILLHTFVYNVCMMTLMCVSIFRFIVIQYAIRSGFLLRRLAEIIAILVTWVFSVLISVPGMVVLIIDPDHDCYIDGISLDVVKTIHHSWRVIILVCIFVTVSLYFCVLCISRRHRRLTTRRNSGVNFHRNNKDLTTTLILTSTLILALLPKFIYVALSTYIPKTSANFPVDMIENLPLVHFISNPIIYAYRTRDIRQGYRRLYNRYLRKCFHLKKWEAKTNNNFHNMCTVTRTTDSSEC